MISTGLLADRIGRRKLLIFALAAAAIGDLIVAASLDPVMYMAGRAIAGVGLGAVFGASFAYIRAVVPAANLPAAMGAFVGYSAVTMIIASFLGGTVASIDWRLAFLVIPALSALSMIAVPLLLPAQSRVDGGKVDVLGQVLLALGVIGVLYGLSHAASGLTSPLTWGRFIAGIVLLIAFAIVERRRPHAFFPIDLLKNPGFLAAIGMGLAFNLVQAVSVLQLANTWQYVYGFLTV